MFANIPTGAPSSNPRRSVLAPPRGRIRPRVAQEFHFFSHHQLTSPADIDAVVAYLKSVAPIRRAVEPPLYKAAMHVDVPPGADQAMDEASMVDPVKRGFYLTTIGHCMECHTPLVDDRHDYTQLGRGGQSFPGPWGVTVSRNITSHATAGLGAWTDAEIKAAITKGLHRGGTSLRPPMAFSLYGTMSDQDLSAIVALPAHGAAAGVRSRRPLCGR